MPWLGAVPQVPLGVQGRPSCDGQGNTARSRAKHVTMLPVCEGLSEHGLPLLQNSINIRVQDSHRDSQLSPNT